MTSYVFRPSLTYLPTLTCFIASDFWGYFGPPTYPKIGRHLWMFPYSILDEWLTNFYFLGLFPIFRHPTQPWMHYITRLKQKCLQTCLCAIFSFQRISIILFERSSWDSAVYLEKFRMLGLAISLWLVNLSVSIRAQYSDRWIPLVPDKLFGYL